jgi:hypothetical protein
MVSDPANQAAVLGWMTRSDPTAVVEAMTEMMTTDLRPALDRIAARTLVIGTWKGWPTATPRRRRNATERLQLLFGDRATLKLDRSRADITVAQAWIPIT